MIHYSESLFTPFYILNGECKKVTVLRSDFVTDNSAFHYVVKVKRCMKITLNYDEKSRDIFSASRFTVGILKRLYMNVSSRNRAV